MLEHIFGSKTRCRLLKIFLLNPQKAFFIRELTRMIDTQINSVRRELDNLLRCGVIRVVSEGENGLEIVGDSEQLEQQNDSPVRRRKTRYDRKEKKYFAVNPSFVLYRELAQVFQKSPLLFQEKFIADIRALEGIDYAVMTGFFAEALDVSVDLLIVGSIPRVKLTKLLSGYEKLFEREINYTTMTTDEFLYRKSLTDRFLTRILDGRKIMVVDSLSR